MCGNFLRFLTSSDFDLRPIQLKIGTPLTCALVMFIPILMFSFLFVLELCVHIKTDRWTDRKDAQCVGWLQNKQINPKNVTLRSHIPYLFYS